MLFDDLEVVFHLGEDMFDDLVYLGSVRVVAFVSLRAGEEIQPCGAF